MQAAFQGKSATDIGKALISAHKNLSAEDALKIAEILTDDKIDTKLPEYLSKKIDAIAESEAKKPKSPKPSKPPKQK